MQCIPEDELLRFFVGHLSRHAEGQIASHLESCARCRTVADRLADDQELRGLQRRLDVNDASLEREKVDQLKVQFKDFGPIRPPWQPGRPVSYRLGEIDAEQPKEVGRFQIERRLGSGGFGAVYLAHDPLLRRKVALKLPYRSTFLEPDPQKRFLRECELTASLHHPNIVPVFEAGDANGICFLATAFISGKSMDKWLRDRGGRVPTKMAARIVADLAHAVQHAHQHRILHRDIKPSNILLDDESLGDDSRCTPKLTDFGLAKLAESDTSITASHVVVGTPRYMAPEQANGCSEKLGPATDVYGLGAVLYEMLTGRAPIKGADTADTLRRVLTEQPPRLRTLVPDIERDLEAICMKCIEKEPVSRYSSAAALAEDLQRFNRGQPTLARPVTHLERITRWTRRNPRAAGLSVASLLAAMVFVVVLMMQNIRLGRVTQDLTFAVGNAKRLQQRAEQSDLLARQHLYCSDLQLADHARSSGDAMRFLQLMKRHVPRPGQLDLRGFEWHCLMQQVHLPNLVLEGGGQPIYYVCYSPDGRRIAAAGKEAIIRIYEVATNHLVRKIPTFQQEVNGLAFAPGGQRIASTGDDGTLRIWDVSTGRQLQAIEACTDAAYQVAMHPSRPLALTCGNEPVIRIWNIESGTAVGTLEGHTDVVEAIALAPDGMTLASAGSDHTARIWNVGAGSQIRTLPHGDGVTCVAFSPSGHRLATGCSDKTSRVWDVRTGVLLTSSAHLDEVQSVAFSPDETTFSSGDRGGTIRLRNFAGRSWSFPPGERIRWCEAARSARVAAAASSRRVGILDLDEGRSYELLLANPRMLRPPGSSPRSGFTDRAFALAPSGNLLACVTEIHVRDPSVAQGWRLQATLDTGSESICSLQFTPDERHLVSGGTDGIVRIWDVNGGTAVSSLIGHKPAPVRALAVSTDGSILASGGDDRQIIVWDTEHSVPRHILVGHRERVNSLAFTPAGNMLLSAGADRSICSWDPHRGEAEAVFEGQLRSVDTLRLSPDGKLIALAGEVQGSVRFWDHGPGELAQDIPGKSKAVSFSSDGSDLIVGVGASVEVLRIRRPAQGRLQLEGQLHTRPERVYALKFSPDGQQLLSGGTSGEVTLWDRLVSPTERSLATQHVERMTPIPGGQSIAAAGAFGVRVIDLATEKVLTAFSFAESPRAAGAARSADDRFNAYRIALSSDGNLLAGATEATVAIWERKTGVSVAAWDFDQAGRTGQIRFSPGSHRLAIAHAQADQVRLLDGRSGRQVGSYQAENPAVLAYSPDGSLLAANSLNEIIVWDAATESVKHRFTGHRNTINDIAFAPTSSLLASVGDDRQLIVWDLAEGAPVFSSVAHDDAVNAVVFSPDGRTLLTGGGDGIVKAWNVATGQALIALTHLPNPIGQLSFSHDGKQLFCQRADGRMTILGRSNDVGLDVFQHTPIERPLAGDATSRSELLAWSAHLTPPGLVHARVDIELAADGDLETLSILTPSYSDRPHVCVLRLAQPQVISRLRVAKVENADSVGTAIDRMDLQILFTSDTGPLCRRRYRPVDGLTNGYEGNELTRADAIDANNATVDNDVHDFWKHGYYSLSFTPVEATAIAIRFARDPSDLEPWTHYPIYEIELYNRDEGPALITDIDVFRAD